MLENNGWTVLNNDGFATREKAYKFISIMIDQHYYGSKNVQECRPLVFRVSENKGKFYIEYKLTE